MRTLGMIERRQPKVDRHRVWITSERLEVLRLGLSRSIVELVLVAEHEMVERDRVRSLF